jgi:hypothetical protein
MVRDLAAERVRRACISLALLRRYYPEAVPSTRGDYPAPSRSTRAGAVAAVDPHRS